MILGKSITLDLGIKMKKNTDRLDFDYKFEKDRRDKHKASKSWRDMRKNHIKAKRHHDRINQDDGRVLVGSKDDGSGISSEGWDFKANEGWDG